MEGAEGGDRKRRNEMTECGLWSDSGTWNGAVQQVLKKTAECPLILKRN